MKDGNRRPAHAGGTSVPARSAALCKLTLRQARFDKLSVTGAVATANATARLVGIVLSP
jgi:hypothetical protein